MRRFSRWMSPAEKVPWGPKAKAVLIILLIAIIVLMVLCQSVRIVMLIVIAILVLGWWLLDRRMRKLAASRPGEDIGSFAGSFDRHRPDFDPWVIRAVWDALQPYLAFRGGVAPLRASDQLESFIDLGDLDMVIFPEVAVRTGRTLENLAANPRYGHVETVADVVEFFWQQPRDQQPNKPLQPVSSAGRTN
jgi:hypothetical protein